MKTPRINSLQTLRLFASLGVVQYHLWENYFDVAIGHPGTDIFLVLVGVVTAYTQAKRIPAGNWWGYIKSRYRRLYVTYIPLFFIALIFKWSEADLGWAVRSFFFIPMDRAPVIGPTWMLSMFMLFYFVFSVCFLVKSEKVLWLLFSAWAILIAMYNLTNWQPQFPDYWNNLLFAERNLDFILGYGVGVILRNGWLRTAQARTLMWAGFFGIVVGTVLLNLGYDAEGRAFIVGVPIAVFILGVSSLELKDAKSGMVRFLTTPWLVWLGASSYVLYLSHTMFFQAWSQVLPVAPIWALPMTVGAVTVGALGYVFWERPVLAYLTSRRIKVPGFSVADIRLKSKNEG
ncbi:MAG: acyltransferase [Chloroflexota bacterium]|nr:acyltransferase [Chloroflexota bacterium]